LYDNIYDDELDEIEAISYNKISYLYNILNINFDKTITIFEGFLDSLFIPNSIGAVGINTNFDFLLNNDLDIRFLFDNDKTGRKKTKKFLNDKKTVFI
jgi:putative salt-induced outer membrane protein YdiY